MQFENNISNILNNKKFFYSPIINGELEIESINYFRQNGFTFLSMSELNQQLFSKERLYSFKINNSIVELNSSQAMKLSAASAIYGKVFSISKCFRNEKSTDNVHLSEFKALELELPIEQEEDIFALIYDYLKYIISWFNEYIIKNNLTDIFKIKKVVFPIKRKDYEETISEYSKKGMNFIFDEFHFCDMDITNVLEEPVIITSYPSSGGWRALKKDKLHSYLYNLILPKGYGELIEFSIRESKYEIYEKKFEKMGYSSHLKWYIDALKYNSNTRAGLGMGIERLGSWLMELQNIGDQLLFPIYPKFHQRTIEKGDE